MLQWKKFGNRWSRRSKKHNNNNNIFKVTIIPTKTLDCSKITHIFIKLLSTIIIFYSLILKYRAYGCPSIGIERLLYLIYFSEYTRSRTPTARARIKYYHCYTRTSFQMKIINMKPFFGPQCGTQTF